MARCFSPVWLLERPSGGTEPLVCLKLEFRCLLKLNWSESDLGNGRETSPVLFVFSHETNYTHAHEFLWSAAAIPASDGSRAKVWEASDASNAPPSSPGTGSQEEHMLTHRAGGALCICQPMQMIRLQTRGCRDKSRPSPWRGARSTPRRRTTTQSQAVPQLVGRRRPPLLTLAQGMRRPGFRGSAPVGSSGHVGSSGSAKRRKNEETNEGRNSWKSSWFQHRDR